MNILRNEFKHGRNIVPSEYYTAKQYVREIISRSGISARTSPLKISGLPSLTLIDDTRNAVGAFKVRGGLSAVGNLLKSDPNIRHVCAASSGSFGMAIAYAASHFGLSSTIYTPYTTPQYKIDKIANLSGAVIRHGDSYESAKAEAIRISNLNPDYHFIDGVSWEVFAGNSTLADEICILLSKYKFGGRIAVIAPLGIGSLIVPLHLTFKENCIKADIISVEPVNFFKFGAKHGLLTPTFSDTIAGGAAVREFPNFSQAMVYDAVDYYSSVEEDEIIETMRYLNSIANIQVEGAGALSVAVVKENIHFFSQYDHVLCILSGSNIGAEFR